ncbi:glycosyltransferase family 87 protein [Kineosporia babensis]|uniref:Glycosyltransferase 87 family protein n=1 Tax=Kineosporia babensis TaxID=499548 RepID=A0A9X1SVM4_9ACTN|nr:glycosyltransferase 87 family protein [Kineosporia babensis]MCD5314157.1 glycosyltransferase 87 family protein [Kineosporia babensis]
MTATTSRLFDRSLRTGLVLMLLAVLGLAVGWVAKAPCIDTYRTADGQIALDWRDARQYSLHCYSDAIPLYGVDRLQDGTLPYKTTWTDTDGTVRAMEYPVVTGLLQYGVMKVTKAWVNLSGAVGPEVVPYFAIMAIVLALAWLAAVACTIPLAVRHWHVALMALSPLVFVHAFTNFDTLAVALAAGGMLAWARNKPVLAGVLLGVGAAAKLYPLFILGPLLILCWRAGVMRPWWKATLTAGAAWVACNAPFALLFPRGWYEFFRLNSVRPADHDSIYNALTTFTSWPGFDVPLYAGESPEKLNLFTLVAFLALCLLIGLIGLTAPRRPRVASLAFLVIAAFLLTNKVWSPQYSLWLVPLAVLALPRVFPLLVWMGVDAYLWYPRLGYFLGLQDPARGNSPEQFLTVVLLRDLLVVILCGMIIHTIYRPGSDPVRRLGVDDPAAGPIAGRLEDHRLRLPGKRGRSQAGDPLTTAQP